MRANYAPPKQKSSYAPAHCISTSQKRTSSVSISWFKQAVKLFLLVELFLYTEQDSPMIHDPEVQYTIDILH